MSAYLILRFEAPLQSWGGASAGPNRPTRDYPSLSAITGLLGCALGWDRSEGRRLNALQDSLRYAVAEVRKPHKIVDYQTVDLGMETARLTRFGLEKRGDSSAANGTAILRKEYLADGAFLVALEVGDESGVGVDDLREALMYPARPLFLGRASCPPATRIYERTVEADSAEEALLIGLAACGVTSPVRAWCEAESCESLTAHEVWDRRDFQFECFPGSRFVEEVLLVPSEINEVADV